MSDYNPFEEEIDVELLLATPRKRYEYFCARFNESEAVQLPKRTQWIKDHVESVEEPYEFDESEDIFELDDPRFVATYLAGAMALVEQLKDRMTDLYFRSAEVPEGATPPEKLLAMYKAVRQDFEGLKNHSAITWEHLASVYPLTDRGTRGGGSTKTYNGPKLRESETNQQFKIRTNTKKLAIVIDQQTFPTIGKGMDYLKTDTKKFNPWMVEKFGVKNMTDWVKLGAFDYEGHKVQFVKS